MRDLYKNIEVPVFEEEKKFRIKKMNAFDGSSLLKFVTSKCLPILQSAVNTLNEAGDEDVEISKGKLIMMVPELLSTISDADLKSLMVMCLKTVEASFPAGWQPVIDAHGNFGIDDIEYDTIACIILCYHVISFNCSDFFGESGLASLLASKIGLPQEQ